MHAGDRHRSSARRCRRRAEADRKPPGVRQDRRPVSDATGCPPRQGAAARRRQAPDRCAGRRRGGGPAAGIALFRPSPHHRRLRPDHPHRRALGRRAADRPRQPEGCVSREESTTRSSAFSRASGTILAATPPNSPISTRSGISIRRIRSAAASNSPPEPKNCSCGCAMTAKPALIFASHLGNWELPALAGPRLWARFGGAVPPPQCRRRRPRHPEDARGQYGHHDRDDGRCAAAAGARAAGRRPCRHADRPVFRPRRRCHVLRPHHQGQPPARPAWPGRSMSRSTGCGSFGCPATASARSCRSRSSRRRDAAGEVDVAGHHASRDVGDRGLGARASRTMAVAAPPLALIFPAPRPRTASLPIGRSSPASTSG